MVEMMHMVVLVVSVCLSRTQSHTIDLHESHLEVKAVADITGDWGATRAQFSLSRYFVAY